MSLETKSPSPRKRVKLEKRKSSKVEVIEESEDKHREGKATKTIISGPKIKVVKGKKKIRHGDEEGMSKGNHAKRPRVRIASESEEKAASPEKTTEEIEKDLKNLNIEPMDKKKGKFEYGDKVDEIIKAFPVTQTGEKGTLTELVFLVRWKERLDGSLPVASQVTNTTLKQYDPQLLISFYESKLHFGNIAAAPGKSVNEGNSEQKEGLLSEKAEKTQKNDILTPNQAGSSNTKSFKKQDFRKPELEFSSKDNKDQEVSEIVLNSLPAEEEKKNDGYNLTNEIMEFLKSKEKNSEEDDWKP